MVLEPDEIERIRLEELSRLEEEERGRNVAAELKGSTPRMEDREGLRLARMQAARRLKRDIEAEYWTERGYKRYVTRNGKILWLTAEEYKERRAMRRKRGRKNGGNPDFVLKERLRKVLIFLGTLILGILLGLQLV